MIQVYDKNWAPRVVLHESGSSNQQVGIQEDDIISISMKSYEHVRLQVNDFIEFLGMKYYLLEAYSPRQVSSVEWQYDVKFHGTQSIIKNALMLSSENTPLEAYTGTARDQLAMVVKNLNRWMDTTDWKAGACVSTGNIVVDYSGGTRVNEALDKIVNGIDDGKTEWWVEGMTVNISRCEEGSPIELGYGNGLLTMERGNADNVKFFTRLVPVGSSRNINPDRYGYSRLQLPGGEIYVEKNTGLFGTIEHYESSAFEGIYPRRTGYVSTVRERVTRDDNGNEYTIYYFTDSSLDFNPNDHEINELVKRVIFQDGELAGMGTGEKNEGFEVNYHPSTREFEIITTWPDNGDRQLPRGVLVPRPGDAYILYNISMPDEYYGMAEREYKQAVDDFLESHSNLTDRSVYKCRTDYIDLDKRGVTLKIGQRVRLSSEEFFPETGYRESRITRITRNLIRPNQADIEVSDVLSRTYRASMNDSITEIKNEVKTSSTPLPDIIKSWENTPPTDTNLYSARKVDKEILTKAISSVEDDEAAGLIKFLKGLIAEEIIRANGGAEFGKFLSGFPGAGAKIDSRGHGEMRSLTLWEFLEVPEFRFNRVDVVSGELWNSIAFGLIENVDSVSCIATLKLVDGELMTVHVDDICRGIFHLQAGNNGVDKIDDCGFPQLAGFGTSYFTPEKLLDEKRFKYRLRPGTSIHPSKGMKFAVYGNFSDKSRQASGYETRTYRRFLNNVDTWVINPDKHIYAQFGELEGLTINGVTLRGYGSYQHNCYFTGTQIQLTPGQRDELQGKDAYSVILSSYEGSIKLASDGRPPVLEEAKNVISGEENVINKVENVITRQHALSTLVQVHRGDKALLYSETPTTGCFSVTLEAVGCAATIKNGVVRVVSITSTGKAHVNIIVNCEGKVTYQKRYNVFLVRDGERGETGVMPRFCGNFKLGTEYVYDSEYRDIINYTIDGDERTFQVKHRGSVIMDPPSSSDGDDNWEVASKFNFLATGLVLSKNAIIDLLQGNKILIRNEDGSIAAGLAGGDIPFWIGAEDPEDAPVRIEKDGSGQLAGGNIKWEKDGTGSVAGGKITWNEDGLRVEGTIVSRLSYSKYFDIFSIDDGYEWPSVYDPVVHGGNILTHGHGEAPSLALPSAEEWDGLTVYMYTPFPISRLDSACVITSEDGFVYDGYEPWIEI